MAAPTPTPTPGIRPATKDDLDSIVWVSAAAFRADPTYTYRYPYIDQYYDDYVAAVRTRYKGTLADPDITMMVYEGASNEDSAVLKPIAYSVWVPVTRKQPLVAAPAGTGDQTQTPMQRHAVPARMRAALGDIEVAKQRLFIDKYGEKQMYLAGLACHPEYERRGAGKALISWGLERAQREKIPIGLFASPKGMGLYKKLGFKEVERFYTQIEGEEERILHVAMVLEN
ncbi:acyl-CoA N-acyltransferase [Xylariaceae sp. FL0255]|nr:acyl-CoA N-acyltransferase [Xylariaceae sp. FL0255]